MLGESWRLGNAHPALRTGRNRTQRRALENQLPGRQGRLALAYLTLHRLSPIPRADLAEALWGATTAGGAETALNALISKLRRVLGPDSIDGGSTVRLSLPAGVRVDLEVAAEAVHAAESALTSGHLARAWAAAQTAMFTARRGFLPGEEARGSTTCAVTSMSCTSGRSKRTARRRWGSAAPSWAAAERAARALTRLTPFRETGYRTLMRALAAQGNVAEALRVYDDLRRLLQDELGIPPSAATRALHEQLVA